MSHFSWFSFSPLFLLMALVTLSRIFWVSENRKSACKMKHNNAHSSHASYICATCSLFCAQTDPCCAPRSLRVIVFKTDSLVTRLADLTVQAAFSQINSTIIHAAKPSLYSNFWGKKESAQDIDYIMQHYELICIIHAVQKLDFSPVNLQV